MGAYAALISKLQENRSVLVGEMKSILDKSATEKRSASKEEREQWDAKDGEVRDLDAQIERYKAQDERETRAADSRAKTGDTGPDDGSAGGQAKVREPGPYDRESRNSYFLDLARAEIHGDREARARLAAHSKDLETELPKRAEARKRTAEKQYETAFASTPADRRRLDRMMATGVDPFERRFISRTDGAGGYFVPPLWLIDEFVPFLRAGREFANLFRSFPLPPGTDSINIPRIVLGTATGPQPGDGAPVPGRDIQDNFVNARIATIAGQQDAAIQLLDQSPIGFDEIIFGDLNADYNMQLDGQLMLGSGFPQLNGLYPAGAGANVASTGATSGTYGYSVQNAATVFSSGTPGTATLYTAVAQLVSLISRTRFMPPTHIVVNPAVWYALSSATDSQGRPLVVPSQQGNNFNQLAGDSDGPVSQGPVGHMLGIPIILDPNVPLTFANSGAQPYMGTISNGNVAPFAGSGTFTPVIAAVFPDLFLWEGEMRSRTLSEVLSGTLQVRFQLYTYVADMVNRYQNSSNNPISYGTYNTTATANSVLSAGGSGALAGF